MRKLSNRVHGVVLAAGAGRRFGGGKLSAEFDGRPLVKWAVEAALSTSVDTVQIVLGSDPQAVRTGLADIQDPRLGFLYCPNWVEGLSASLAYGVQKLPPDTRGAIIYLGDMPYVPVDLAERVLSILLEGATAVTPIFRGKPAHPVGISSALFSRLQSPAGNKGPRQILREEIGTVEIQTENAGSVFDIDYPEDLRGTNNCPPS